jgi:hypothetical protein
MDTLDTKNEQNEQSIFVCEKCDYKCIKKTNFIRHLSTAKHLWIHNGYIMDTKNEQNEQNEQNENTNKFVCTCGKQYKYSQGLSKHKKTCNYLTEPVKNDNEEAQGDLLNFLLKENQEFKKIILEFANKSGQPTTTTIHGNNNCNNRFNINMFLNEKCKDAMNIMDFVDSLKLTLQDLEKTAELGYVKGISKIIVNGLNQLDVCKRPIHCSDSKRETLYIKDNNAWEKENEDKKKITRAIKHISIRNAKQVGEWTKENKGYCDSSSKKNDKYLKIVSEANGGEPEEINKIISNISTKVTIDKEKV